MGRCDETKVTVGPTTLNSYWRPTRNPGSVEDFKEPKEYLEHLTYHGGLNTAVWKRTVPKRIDVSEEPASEEDRLPSGAESAEKMICYWKAKDTTSEQTLTGEWQEKETGEKTSDGDSSVEGMSCSTCGCTGDASETSEEDKKQDSTGSVQRETAPLYLSPTVGRKPAEREKRDSVPSGPGSWLLLFSFLLTVILYRVFLVPEATICARR